MYTKSKSSPRFEKKFRIQVLAKHGECLFLRLFLVLSGEALPLADEQWLVEPEGYTPVVPRFAKLEAICGGSLLEDTLETLAERGVGSYVQISCAADPEFL